MCGELHSPERVATVLRMFEPMRCIVAWTATPKTALGALLRERLTPTPEAKFPDNLTLAELRTVEAYIKTRNQTQLAKHFGLTRYTIFEQLRSARHKAGSPTTDDMLKAYRKAVQGGAK